MVIPARNAIRGELNKIERNERITERMLREPDMTQKIHEIVTLVRTNDDSDSLLLGSMLATLKVESGLRAVAEDKKAG